MIYERRLASDSSDVTWLRELPDGVLEDVATIYFVEGDPTIGELIEDAIVRILGSEDGALIQDENHNISMDRFPKAVVPVDQYRKEVGR